MTWEDDFTAEYAMPIFAFRYCLGRMSTAVPTCVRWLRANWNKLDDHSRSVIQRDLEEAFKRDDEERVRAKALTPEEGTRLWRPLGHDCDRAEWSKVRALYRTPRCVFCDRELPKDAPQTRHTDGEHSCRACVPFECERCGEPFKLLENYISDPVTRRARHVRKCGKEAA
jgi:hypothetical protein